VFWSLLIAILRLVIVVAHSILRRVIVRRLVPIVQRYCKKPPLFHFLEMWTSHSSLFIFLPGRSVNSLARLSSPFCLIFCLFFAWELKINLTVCYMLFFLHEKWFSSIVISRKLYFLLSDKWDLCPDTHQLSIYVHLMILTPRINIFWEEKVERTEANLTVNRHVEETFFVEHGFVNTEQTVIIWFYKTWNSEFWVLEPNKNTSAPPYVFRKWCLLKRWDNFTFISRFTFTSSRVILIFIHPIFGTHSNWLKEDCKQMHLSCRLTQNKTFAPIIYKGFETLVLKETLHASKQHCSYKDNIAHMSKHLRFYCPYE